MQHLRPMERRVLALAASGLDTTEIGRRFKRSPAHIERVMAWAGIPRRRSRKPRGMSPKERRVVAMRDAGISYEDIAARFRASPEHIRRIEGYADLRRELGRS